MQQDINIHQKYMRRAFQLARTSMGLAAPNPMVGALLVAEDRIIGEGKFNAYGVDHNHAEVNAVASVRKEDQHLISKATLYVSLEPCNFHGKTPACTSLILNNKIPRVVISTIDKTPQVSGNGIELLRTKGVEVITGILEIEGDEVVRIRTNYVKNKFPYIILKFAQSKDGFIGQKNKSIWITNPLTKRLVHKWRNEVQAIMVGTNTARQDNPKLTNRLYYGKSPLRVVLDRKNNLPTDLHLLSDGLPTWVITENINREFSNNQISFQKVAFDDSLLENILAQLHEFKIGSLLVEGGAQLLNSFIEKGFWHEARILEGNVYLKEGIKAPKFHSPPTKTLKIDGDILRIFKNDRFDDI
jgi:diaminohydroxyphosphoribosylaminopyrimidine deaminase/5-amino-6-(5-phosphoribosylamino)uracil reductase